MIYVASRFLEEELKRRGTAVTDTDKAQRDRGIASDGMLHETPSEAHERCLSLGSCWET